jgi:DNA-directed RNA polymerase sigma subunit (sigma70/sigma32)
MSRNNALYSSLASMKKISLRTNKRSCVTLDITASTRIFFNEIRKYPDSDAQQEPVEFSKIRAGDEKAREAMIASHMKYVVSVASFYLLPGLELNDLIQEGNH